MPAALLALFACARALAFASLLALSGACAATAAPSPYADWAAVVVAGDDHASHTETLTEAFDNARRDVAKALVAKGFSPANVAQFSTRPGRYAATHPGPSDAGSIEGGLHALSARAPAGCLVYVTSHGAPEGVLLGDRLLSARRLRGMLDRSCPARPTVVVLSACYSGALIPGLRRPDRLILTAARRDRSSFGCGESDTYPFFDSCILESLPGAEDFPALGLAARACVARKELREGMTPPSEPQIWRDAAFHPPPFSG